MELILHPLPGVDNGPARVLGNRLQQSQERLSTLESTLHPWTESHISEINFLVTRW